MTDVGFLVAVMDLMGHRERDGHSGAWAMAQSGRLLPPGRSGCGTSPTGCGSSPRATPYADLVGARVTMVGHLAVADARQAVEPLVPRDNSSSLRANLPIYLLLPKSCASSASSPPAIRV